MNESQREVLTIKSDVFSDKVILNNALDLDKGSSDIGSALKYFNSITDYMMQLRNALGELRDDIE